MNKRPRDDHASFASAPKRQYEHESGMGRAARRQLAAILDEFWGQLFDYHGKLTQEANAKRFNYLIGLDMRAAGSAVRNDSLSIEASRNPMMRDATQGSATVLNTWDSHDKDISNQDTGIGMQMGTMGPPTWSQSKHLPNRDIPSSGRTFLEQNAKLYSNFHTSNQLYQLANIHGYQLANYLKGVNASRNPYSSTPLDPWRPPRSSESDIPNYTGPAMNVHTHNLLGSFGDSSLQSRTLNRLSTMAAERSSYDPISIGGSESVGSSANSKKYHSSPDISAVIASSRDSLLNEANVGGPAANQACLSRLASEKSRYVDLAVRPSSLFTELSQHNVQRDMLSTHLGMNTKTKSLWSQQPFEQLFGVSSSELNSSEVDTGQGASSAMKDDFSYTQFEAELLKSLRFCIIKLLKLEGSEWLFSRDGGCDENLIDQVSEAERVSQEGANVDRDATCIRRLPNCGDGCVWQSSLIVSFGVWCIHRVLDLSRVESRPDLWGKYTYVLNRLQGIIDPSFSNPRKPLVACACLPKASPVGKPVPGSFITAATILEVIKRVESRKGRSGTTAGDVAFPKGKANLVSVLKRYKRRLANKTPPRR